MIKNRNGNLKALKLEYEIISIWRRLLPDTEIGLDDDFFDLGGHSIMIMEMMMALREIVPKNIPIEQFLERPTIRHLVDLTAPNN